MFRSSAFCGAAECVCARARACTRSIRNERQLRFCKHFNPTHLCIHTHCSLSLSLSHYFAQLQIEKCWHRQTHTERERGRGKEQRIPSSSQNVDNVEQYGFHLIIYGYAFLCHFTCAYLYIWDLTDFEIIWQSRHTPAAMSFIQENRCRRWCVAFRLYSIYDKQLTSEWERERKGLRWWTLAGARLWEWGARTIKRGVKVKNNARTYSLSLRITMALMQ